MEKAKILMIDDDLLQCEQAKTLFNNEIIAGKEILWESTSDFSNAIRMLEEQDFDLIVLDLKGDGLDDNGLPLGEGILETIKKTCFIPVIFYTGFSGSVQSHESELIRIVNKSSSLSGLKIEIENVLTSKLPFIKKSLNNYIKESLRSYLWDFVHHEWSTISEITDEISLNYLLARRLAHTLSKDKILELIGEQTISSDFIHPMEFYVYPPMNQDYSTGDILKKDNSIFILLTPTCDLVLKNGMRSAEEVVMVEAISLEDTKEYKKYEETRSNNAKGDLKKLVEGKKNRFFFLPGTNFIPDLILDFQKIRFTKESDLVSFEKITELDSPFSEGLLSRFVGYYNRIGLPDLNVETILEKIDRRLGT